MSELDELKYVPTPPPLPPPQPPLQTFKQSPHVLNTINKTDFSVKIPLEEDFSELFFISNTYLEPQLQDGPNCGLVALSIATSGSPNFVSVDSIFQTALSLGFTKQGEMFSADSLAVLAEKCCGFRTKVIEGNLNTHLKCIIESLLRKCLLLVPYDADFNHYPCCKSGSKAHWAVISGFVIIQKNKSENNFRKENHSVVLGSSKCSGPCDCIHNSTDANLPLIVSADLGRALITKKFVSDGNEIDNELREGKVYLIGRQGKSRHFGMWPFDDMADSNDNLVAFSAGRNPESYLLPKNGLVEGLKGKAIILECP